VRRGVRSIALVGVLCACQGLERASQETARNLARDVEQLVSADTAAAALLLIEEALASAPQDARLRFVEGWYHNTLADRPGFDRRARLASAERAYARAVELQADYRSAIYNWAIVLDELEKLAVAPVRPDGSARPGALETIARIVDRVPVDRITYDALLVQGDVLARHARAASVAETFAAALRAYGRAEDSRPASVAARRRRTALLMELCDLDPQGGVASDPEGGWAQRLRSASDADFAEGFDELASAGFHFLVAHCMDDPEGALDSWLIARARLGVLTSRELPAAEFRACAAVTPAVDGLERLWADPVALAQDLRRQPDDYWMSSDARRVAIALALQAEAQRRSLQAASSPVDDPDTDLDEGAERRALLEPARARRRPTKRPSRRTNRPSGSTWRWTSCCSTTPTPRCATGRRATGSGRSCRTGRWTGSPTPTVGTPLRRASPRRARTWSASTPRSARSSPRRPVGAVWRNCTSRARASGPRRTGAR
jgi:tetratricopeptide (TPR) repeat protein